MSYTRKKYTSRREKLERNNRNIKLVFIFGAIALVVWLYKNRWEISDWVKPFFYVE